MAGTDHGVRLVFRAEPGIAEELKALAALERECCAFAEWAVDVRGEEVGLHVSGDSPEATAAFREIIRTL